jgi:3-hydroxyacyl-[acyl-carrier-protein] dehydratase/UDP-3-O-[3-hydroxymyristoyl] N-acetylglucosamine deacetylase/3-hydroxyacyl-[acyl-carrier-protein] dehydratase
VTPGAPEPVIKIEEIVKLLPHRFPFLMVDRVIQLEPGKSIVAIKNVSCNESFFQGHFPDVKIMPGVLIIEALAQAGGILLYHSFPEPQKKLVVLSKIDKLKFRKAVVPGDQLRLEAEITKVRTKFATIKGRAVVDGEVVAEGEISAAVIDLVDGHEPS